MFNDNWYKAHAIVEALEYEEYRKRHPETKELLPIREEIFNAPTDSHKKNMEYVLHRIEDAGYECVRNEKYPDEFFYGIYKNEKKMGGLSFTNQKRISMFSCDQ